MLKASRQEFPMEHELYSCFTEIPIPILSESSGLLTLFIDGFGIQGPHSTTMGGNHDDIVPWMNDQVMDKGRRQVASQDIPGFPSIFCYINTDVSANIEDVFVDRIFSNDIDRTEGNVS